MMLSEIEFFATLYVKILYMIGRDFFMMEIDGFRLLQQLFIPAFTGGVGGLSLMVMASLTNYGEFSLKKFYKIYIKLALLGGIAGIAAVNLLNPGGDISQVMVLGLIAGLSGFSYLKRNSLVDSIHEDALLKGMRESVFKEAKQFLGESKIKGRVEDEVEVEVEDAIDQDEFEDEDEDEDEDEVEPDKDEVDKYINRKVDEWMSENLDATIDEIQAYYEEVLDDVYANPEIMKLEE